MAQPTKCSECRYCVEVPCRRWITKHECHLNPPEQKELHIRARKACKDGWTFPVVDPDAVACSFAEPL